MVKIRVPATSANIGPGFDCMGLAIRLYNYVYMDFSTDFEVVNMHGCRVVNKKSNLIYKAATYIFKFCGFKNFESLKIVQKSNIPQTRGLGSSSACIVAGLVGANFLLGSPLTNKEILNIANKLEGHPDNVAPAIFGGLVVCANENSNVFYVKHYVSKKLKFVFLIPNFKMSTAKARKVLKKEVSMNDAIFNVSRASFFISSILSGKFSDLNVAVKDKLHQSQRLKLIENGDIIFKVAYSLGAYGVYLSGSGPSIVAICDCRNSNFESFLLKKLKDLKINNWNVYDFRIDTKGVVAQKV